MAAVVLAGLAAACLVRPPVRRLPFLAQLDPGAAPRRDGAGAVAGGPRSGAGAAAAGSTAGPVGPVGPAERRPTSLAAALPLAAGGLVAALAGPVPGLLAGAAVLALRLRRRRVRAATAEAAVRVTTVELCLGLAASLRAGSPPAAALVDAVDGLPEHPAFGRLAAAVAAGASPVDAFERAASTPGASGLRRAAACWSVASGTGAGLAVALERVADGLRADEGARRSIKAQLAGPRSTARLLGALPVVGVGMGTLLGAAPLDVLLGSLPGLACLTAGAVLSVLGVAWTERIARAADPL
nr:type II secretion system F family protein [Motilibacter aurantiacus]